MTYPQVWFVDAPSEDANVRLDLNNAFGLATLRVEHEGFTLGAPPLLGEPDAVSAALGLREPSWNQQIRGPKNAAHEVRTALSRELLRPTNWVRVRMDAASPVYYLQAYRGDYGALDLTFVKNDSGTDVWRLPVSLTAEPLLLGERIILGPYTVTQSPDGDYPMSVVLPEIEGDAPAPLRVSISRPDVVHTGYDHGWLVSSTSATEGVGAVLIDIGTDDGFDDTAYSTVVTGSQYFGGSARRVAADDAYDEAAKLSGQVDPPPGVYGMYLRCRATVTADPSTLIVRLRRTAGDPISTQTVSLSGGTFLSGQVREVWVDLGTQTFPFGTRLEPGEDYGVRDSFVEFGLDHLVGEPDIDVDVDALLLVPRGGQDVSLAYTLEVRVPRPNLDAELTVVDGQYKNCRAVAVGGVYDGTLWDDTAVLEGGFPMADPAAGTTILAIVALDSGTGLTAQPLFTNVDAESEVTVSYHPRKLHI